MIEGEERVLVYVGPTISKEETLAIVPDAIVKPPAKQSDIISDIVQIQPTHLLLIDGEFSQNLSVWIKELMYALIFPSLEGRVYGSSSMGALRAADVADWGMIGYGTVFDWYYEGLIDDDSEVALSYSVDDKGIYRQNTVPLVNVRATLLKHKNPDWRFRAAQRIHWSERTPEAIASVWNETQVKIIDQKKDDAIGLLTTFRLLKSSAKQKPSHKHVSTLFLAQYDRDRRVSIQGVQIPLQNIDSHVALSSTDNYRIMEETCNRTAALLLCDVLGVAVTEEEVGMAQGRFGALRNLDTIEDLNEWLSDNALSRSEFVSMMVQNARLFKLHNSIKTTKLNRRMTHEVLTYLRNAGRFDSFALDAAEVELRSNLDDVPTIDLMRNVAHMLKEHAEARKVPLLGNVEEFSHHFGFGTVSELYVSLARYDAKS